MFLNNKVGTVDLTNFDKGIAFGKLNNCVAFRSGHFRNSPMTTYYEPSVMFKNTPVPKTFAFKGKYTQVNGQLMYFMLSVQRPSDKAYYRALILADQSGVTTVQTGDGVRVDNELSLAANRIVPLKLSDTLDVKVNLTDQPGYNSFVAGLTEVNIGVESILNAYSSTGSAFPTYPFYLNYLHVTF